MKIKANKGITLVTLVITIVALLIISIISIKAVKEQGILSQTKNAQTDFQIEVDRDNTLLADYKKNNLKPQNDLNGRKLVYDVNNNKIVIPSGFEILVDNTTDYTADTIDVTKGIVIIDVNAGNTGSQFVWIPVGEIYTNAGTKTITLGRYIFNVDGSIGESTTGVGELKDVYNFTEKKKNETSVNAHAKDIEAFITSVNKNGGFYIGRYEAGDGTTTTARDNNTSDDNALVCKPDVFVYNYIDQDEASTLSQGMYANKTFTSDLINSFSWDTAILFIQEFSGDNDYSRQKSLNTALAKTGISGDKQCNIYDMASNCVEWSTETSDASQHPRTKRGAAYGSEEIYRDYASDRDNLYSTTHETVSRSFRPIIYL